MYAFFWTVGLYFWLHTTPHKKHTPPVVQLLALSGRGAHFRHVALVAAGHADAAA